MRSARARQGGGARPDHPTRPAGAPASPARPGAAGRAELWCSFAIVLLLCTAGAFVYLGARPGGRGPLVVYRFGRDVLFVLAFLTLIWGLFRSWRRPPLQRPGRVRAFLALGLVIAVAPYRLPYPSSRENRPSRVRFELPVRGTWRTYWGGDDKQANRLVGFFADRRYGLDLVREVEGSRVRPQSAGGPADGVPRRPQDFWTWGETVHAPAPGRVVSVRDGIEDSPLSSWGAGPPGGNLLVLEVAAGEYLFVAHLLAGSFRVTEGETVDLGEPLARVGYSGFSPITPEPHLALHLQTTAQEGWGEGIPWRFHGYRLSGQPVVAGIPRGGVDANLGPVGELLDAPGPTGESDPGGAREE